MQYTDINGDGKAELLVNNHEKKDDEASVFVYSVPEDLFNGEYKRTVIMQGFKNVFNLMTPNMSPGFCYPVYPKVSEKGKGPAHVLIAGDGDHSAHLLRP